MSDTPSELSAQYPQAEEDNTPQPAASSRGTRSPAGTMDITKRTAPGRALRPLKAVWRDPGWSKVIANRIDALSLPALLVCSCRRASASINPVDDWGRSDRTPTIAHHQFRRCETPICADTGFSIKWALATVDRRGTPNRRLQQFVIAARDREKAYVKAIDESTFRNV